VRPLIENALAQVPEVEAIVFEPSARPEPVTASAKSPNLTAGRAALVGLIGRYLAGMMDTSITLLEVHKLMYFLQRAGEPLRLNYTEAFIRPYAENLRHVLAAINGHLITGFAAGDDPTTELELVPGALERARAFLAERTKRTLASSVSPNWLTGSSPRSASNCSQRSTGLAPRGMQAAPMPSATASTPGTRASSSSHPSRFSWLPTGCKAQGSSRSRRSSSSESRGLRSTGLELDALHPLLKHLLLPLIAGLWLRVDLECQRLLLWPISCIVVRSSLRSQYQ